MPKLNVLNVDSTLFIDDNVLNLNMLIYLKDHEIYIHILNPILDFAWPK